MEQPVLIEIRGGDLDRPEREPDPPDGRPRLPAVLAGILALLVGTVVVGATLGGDGEGRTPIDTGPREVAQPFTRIPEVVPGQQVPDPVRAATCFAANPNARHLRTVFESIGGFDGLDLGTATGAFDVVTFDALDPDRLIAAQRGGYGPAEHRDVTQRWVVAGGTVTQTLWDPSTSHDFAHHNTDGTLTMWIPDGATDGVAPRTAVTTDVSGASITASSAPIFADRFAVDDRTVFALTGGPDWYRPRDAGHRSLVADDGERQVELASGAEFGWLDVPAPGLLVAYPLEPSGGTAVWDTATLEPLVDHPLAGRRYQRVAISGDGAIAVGVTAGGELEPLDLSSGRSGPRFGTVDVREVDRPIVASRDGSVVFTVERSGVVSIWFVGEDVPLATFAAGSGVPRWLPTSRSAARLASALSPDGTRLALRIDARPRTSVSWRVIDTDVDSWLARARSAGPPETPGALPRRADPLLTPC